HQRASHGKEAQSWFSFDRVKKAYTGFVQGALKLRWLLLLVYLGLTGLLIGWWGLGHAGLGTEVFPSVDTGQFQLRLRAPNGTPLEDTEALTKDVLDAIASEVGEKNVDITVSLVGTASYNYPINAIYLWTAGPQEAVLNIALKSG